MKRILFVVAAGVLVGLLVLAWGWQQWTGPGPVATNGQATVRVRIPQGMTLSAAADTLVARGLLARRRTLLGGARLTGQDRGLRSGLYELAYGQSPRDLLTDLTTGLSVQTVVTLPEGLHSGEIADILASSFGFSASRFQAVADSLARRLVHEQELLGPSLAVATYDSQWATAPVAAGVRAFHWCEGLLAPDTYHFAEGSEPVLVASLLLAAQQDRLAAAVARAAGGVNTHLSPWELLTLASVVEAEARRDDERTRIAAVYTNRLQRNWRLEADPTVAFILDKKGDRLYFKHLKVDSPYNTYRHKGLPPGPIGAAGQGSLWAAARPDTTCRAMYFVSDGADGHVFSRTAREHEVAVRQFKKARSRGQGR